MSPRNTFFLMIALVFLVFILFITSIEKKQENTKKFPIQTNGTQASKKETATDISTAPLSSLSTDGNNGGNTITQLKAEDVKIGDGEEAVSGKKVTVNYVGLLIDGTKFDSSYDRNTPFIFTLGQGEVIKGWDLGIVGMRVGGKRRLTIPSDLAYGERGAGNAIPPNSPLFFEVDLLKVE